MYNLWGGGGAKLFMGAGELVLGVPGQNVHLHVYCPKEHHTGLFRGVRANIIALEAGQSSQGDNSDYYTG